MTDFIKYLVLVLFLLLPTQALPQVGSAPAGAASDPGMASPEAVAGFEAGQEASETRAMDVIGRGTIYRDDVATARDKAIADALHGVVEQAVGLLISPASVIQDFQLLSDRVYDQTEAFIHHYKVLTESRSGRYYRVVVRATVSMSAIQDRLQDASILVTPEGMPAIIFFLSEQNIGEPSPQYRLAQSPIDTHPPVVEKTISGYMREKGFKIVESMGRGREIHPVPEHMGSELSDEVAVNLGKELGADLVIVGSALAHSKGSASDKNMKTIQAGVSTRAISTDNGMVIASSRGTREAVHSDERVGGTEALILSASVVAQDLVRQIVAKWHREVREPVLVELVVKGIREYADFVRFRKRLGNDVRGVRNVYLRSIKAGEAKMDVDFRGNARILADELILQRFESLAVNIVEVSEKGVELELVPAAIDN